MKKILLPVLCLLLALGCNNMTATNTDQEAAQAFIDSFTTEYQKLITLASEASWQANVAIREGDTSLAWAQQKADEAAAAFTGSVANIEKEKGLLTRRDQLSPLQVKQLETMLYLAANNPQTIPEVVKDRIKAESEQTQKLYGFRYTLNGKQVTTNDLDDILKTEIHLDKRLAAWNASKEVGKNLKEGLVHLRELRNQTVQALDYPDYFSYQVSDYGMSANEMMQTMDQLMADLWPLYRELHTYMRYELSQKYGQQSVPDYLPAHWLPNRWGQDWSPFVTVQGLNLDSVLKTKSAAWVVQEGEKLYTSLGFQPLPDVFWQKSNLYPYPADSAVKKNNHASAWHMDLDKDVRSLMSVTPNAEWYETVNHELGHIYYYMAYARPEVPILLREGANRAYHEAVGTMMGMAAMQKPYLVGRGLVAADAQTDSIQSLLKEAMNAVVFIYFSSGTMSHFEKELYADQLPREQFNKRWWELAKKYQGIIPPAERGEMYCDATTKTHINDDAAQYYDYALSYVILYQLHQHIATQILKQDPRATNYYGSKPVGNFLKGILSKGATQDWQTLLKENTGQTLNAKAMLDYFAPLVQWLQEQNKDRNYTLPEKM